RPAQGHRPLAASRGRHPRTWRDAGRPRGQQGTLGAPASPSRGLRRQIAPLGKVRRVLGGGEVVLPPTRHGHQWNGARRPFSTSCGTRALIVVSSAFVTTPSMLEQRTRIIAV